MGAPTPSPTSSGGCESQSGAGGDLTPAVSLSRRKLTTTTKSAVVDRSEGRVRPGDEMILAPTPSSGRRNSDHATWATLSGGRYTATRAARFRGDGCCAGGNRGGRDRAQATISKPLARSHGAAGLTKGLSGTAGFLERPRRSPGKPRTLVRSRPYLT